MSDALVAARAVLCLWLDDLDEALSLRLAWRVGQPPRPSEDDGPTGCHTGGSWTSRPSLSASCLTSSISSAASGSRASISAISSSIGSGMGISSSVGIVQRSTRRQLPQPWTDQPATVECSARDGASDCRSRHSAPPPDRVDDNLTGAFRSVSAAGPARTARPGDGGIRDAQEMPLGVGSRARHSVPTSRTRSIRAIGAYWVTGPMCRCALNSPARARGAARRRTRWSGAEAGSGCLSPR